MKTMLENIVELMERFVVAHEKIAKAIENCTNCNRVDDQPVPKKGDNDATHLSEVFTNAEEKIAEGNEHFLEQEKVRENVKSYDQMDLVQLKEICADRGIEVPKGTRKTTLVKNLNAYDTGENVPEKKAVTPPPLPEVDPFAEETTLPPPELTIKDVRYILQKLMAKKGPNAVIRIIKKHASVEQVNEVPKEKYDAVFKTAQKELN
jgi:hypothetical protein